jgi:hypothetical protein
VIDDDLRHAFEIFVEQSDQSLWPGAMGHRGEALDLRPARRTEAASQMDATTISIEVREGSAMCYKQP